MHSFIPRYLCVLHSDIMILPVLGHHFCPQQYHVPTSLKTASYGVTNPLSLLHTLVLEGSLEAKQPAAFRMIRAREAVTAKNFDALAQHTDISS